MSFKIEVDQGACIGCGACAAQCDNFEIDSEGKAQPKKKEVKDIGCNQDAADACPVSCIKIIKK